MKKISSVMVALLLMLSVPAIAETVNYEKLPHISNIAMHINHGEQYFAATGGGIFVSKDRGKAWTDSGNFGLPATMVAESADHKIYAFVVGKGLLRFDDKKSQWDTVNNQFGSQVITQLLTESNRANHLLALNQFGKLVVSENSGKDWHRIQGPYVAKSEKVKRGQSLYEKKCQSCHGIDGVGETYNITALTDKNYLKAPALNDSEHAWHHTDEALAKTILDGSAQGSRMPAWKNSGMTEQNAEDLVSYIKSLWTQRELDCQGPKHMQCM
jgi:mono/diheme cytochrome c family protein